MANTLMRSAVYPHDLVVLFGWISVHCEQFFSLVYCIGLLILAIHLC